MQNLSFHHRPKRAAPNDRDHALVGVVASGNLEILLERSEPEDRCTVEIATPVRGYDEVWEMVIADFVERASPGGLRVSINDGGARPDTVMLRLLQGVAALRNDGGSTS